MTTARERLLHLMYTMDDGNEPSHETILAAHDAYVDERIAHVLSAAEGRTQKTSDDAPDGKLAVHSPVPMQEHTGVGASSEEGQFAGGESSDLQSGTTSPTAPQRDPDCGTDSDALKLSEDDRCSCGKHALKSWWASITDAGIEETDYKRHARDECLTRTERDRRRAPASPASSSAPADGRPDREALGRAAYEAWCFADGNSALPWGWKPEALGKQWEAWRYVGERLYEMGRKDGEARATLVADGDETDAGIARYMAAEARQKAEEGRRWPDVFVLFDAVFAERPVDVRVANDGLDANEVRYVPAARAEKAERERDESYARGNAPATTYRQRAESASRDRDAAVARAEAAERRWRPEVVAFADAMERELRENDHKGGWQDDSATSLVKRVIEETTELAREVKRPHEWATPEHWQVRVLSEAADVANFAMMVADVCGALPLRPAAPTADDGDEKEKTT